MRTKKMQTFETVLTKEIKIAKGILEEKQQLYDFLSAAQLLNTECSFGFSAINQLTVWFDSNESAAEAAKQVLAVCGKLKKSFNEYSGTIVYTGKKDNITIRLHVKPTNACIVEPYEVELQKTGTEKVTKYRMIGNCDPLLAQTKEQKE